MKISILSITTSDIPTIEILLRHYDTDRIENTRKQNRELRFVRRQIVKNSASVYKGDLSYLPAFYVVLVTIKNSKCR